MSADNQADFPLILAANRLLPPPRLCLELVKPRVSGFCTTGGNSEEFNSGRVRCNCRHRACRRRSPCDRRSAQAQGPHLSRHESLTRLQACAERAAAGSGGCAGSPRSGSEVTAIQISGKRTRALSRACLSAGLRLGQRQLVPALHSRIIAAGAIAAGDEIQSPGGLVSSLQPRSDTLAPHETIGGGHRRLANPCRAPSGRFRPSQEEPALLQNSGAREAPQGWWLGISQKPVCRNRAGKRRRPEDFFSK